LPPWARIEELAISFGEILMPAIRQIVTWVQGFVDKLNSMDEGTKNTIVTIGLLAAAIGPVLIIIGKVVSAVGSIMTFIPTLIGGISSIGGGLSALWGILAANPVTLVIAAIAALIAIFSNEGISILENAARTGLPIPGKLKAVLEQLREEKEN